MFHFYEYIMMSFNHLEKRMGKNFLNASSYSHFVVNQFESIFSLAQRIP